MSLFTQLRAAVRRHAEYHRTLNELRSIPDAMAEDLGIYPGDARRVAHAAIYG